MRLFPSRKYKSGTRWCIWRWTEVPSDFIRRLHIIKTPWFAICLHWINAADPEPHLHDHPITFLSLILKGWYKELRTTLKLWNNVGPRSDQSGSPFDGVERRWFNFIRADWRDRHTITEVSPGGAVTLCFMGPKVREWGYHTPDGWVCWKDYNKEKYGSL